MISCHIKRACCWFAGMIMSGISPLQIMCQVLGTTSSYYFVHIIPGTWSILRTMMLDTAVPVVVVGLLLLYLVGAYYVGRWIMLTKHDSLVAVRCSCVMAWYFALCLVYVYHIHALHITLSFHSTQAARFSVSWPNTKTQYVRSKKYLFRLAGRLKRWISHIKPRSPVPKKRNKGTRLANLLHTTSFVLYSQYPVPGTW